MSGRRREGCAMRVQGGEKKANNGEGDRNGGKRHYHREIA